MLQKMHDRIKGWVAAVIIGLLCVGFVLWGVQYYVSGAQEQGDVIAKVAGEKITKREVNLLVRRMQQEVTAGGTALTEAVNQQLRMAALQNLIAEIALSQAAIKSGFTVQKVQLQQLVGQIPAFQEKGQFSPQRFQQFLTASGMNQAQLLAQLRTDLLINQVSTGIEASTFLLPNEFTYYYNLLYQQRHFQYVTIPAKLFVHKANPTLEEEKTYYQNNKELLRTPQQVSIQYIELSPQHITQSVKVSDAELQQYYQAHPTEKPLAAVKTQIKTLLVQQKAQQLIDSMGDQLSNLAFTNPDSLQPAAKALHVAVQDSTFFTEAGTKTGISAYPEIVAVAFSKDVLQKKNNSRPITLKDGRMVVLRVKRYLPSQTPEFSAEKARIHQLLVQQNAQVEAALLAAELQQKLQQGKAIDAIIQKNNLHWIAEKNIRRNDKKIPSAILNAAFNLSLKKDKASTMLGLPNGDSAVIKLLAIQPPNLNELNAEQKQQLQQKIQQTFAQMRYRLYMEGVQKNTAVKYSIKGK